MAHDVELLKRVAIFAGLSREARAALAAATVQQRYRRRQPIYVQGDPARAIYIVAVGSVRVARLTEDGREVVLGFVGPGQVFGETALIGDEPRSDEAQALEESLVYAIPATEVLAAARHDAGFGLRVARLFAERLQAVEGQVEKMASQDVPGRLASLLLELARIHGRASADGIQLGLSVAHQDLANHIGSARETTTNTLNDFRRRGLIDLRPLRITIKKPRQLQAMALSDGTRLAGPGGRIVAA